MNHEQSDPERSPSPPGHAAEALVQLSENPPKTPDSLPDLMDIDYEINADATPDPDLPKRVLYRYIDDNILTIDDINENDWDFPNARENIEESRRQMTNGIDLQVFPYDDRPDVTEAPVRSPSPVYDYDVAPAEAHRWSRNGRNRRQRDHK